MTINIGIVLVILAVHWLNDFVLQTSWQAENKSKSWEALLSHTFWYSMMWMFPILGLFTFSNPHESEGWYFAGVVSFISITFICHTATDYYTSRVNAILWEKKDVHTFFCSIGMDQLLHYIQLILTFYYLTN